VSFRVSEFKRGRTHTNDEPHSGRPKTATTPEIVDKIHHMVLADRRIKVHEIAEAVRMSDERVFHILHNEFDLKKLSADVCRVSSVRSKNAFKLKHQLRVWKCFKGIQRISRNDL
jgi:hypothetical protein